MSARLVILVLWAAALLSGCAEVSRSLNGAGQTIDGWFSPNK